MERSLPEHKAILSAIAGRQPDAARLAMAEHLATMQRYLSEYAQALAAGDGSVAP
jgi:DNA-binding FadR family transcriptional regulator